MRIAARSGLADLPWEFHVINSRERNAFVLPGGKVFVFTGILPVMANDAGMAAVLGHEIGHMVARHVAEKISISVVIGIVQLTLKLLLGVGVDQIAGTVFQLMLDLPYSRKAYVCVGRDRGRGRRRPKRMRVQADMGPLATSQQSGRAHSARWKQITSGKFEPPPPRGGEQRCWKLTVAATRGRAHETCMVGPGSC